MANDNQDTRVTVYDGSEGDVTTAQNRKVTELTESLRHMRTDFESFKRTSSMERDALVKELSAMKGVAQVVDDLEAYQKEERDRKRQVEANPNAAPVARQEGSGCAGPDAGAGIASVFESLSDQFDDDGYMKCCLACN